MKYINPLKGKPLSFLLLSFILCMTMQTAFADSQQKDLLSALDGVEKLLKAAMKPLVEKDGFHFEETVMNSKNSPNFEK